MATKVLNIVLGRRIRGAEFRDFTIAQTDYAPSVSLALHEHDFTYCSLVLRGGFQESVGRNVELAKSASVVVMPAGVAHGEFMGPLGARSITFSLKAPFLDAVMHHERPFKQWRWFHGGPVARIMLRAYQEWLLSDVEAGLGITELLLLLPETIGGERAGRVGSARPSVAGALEWLHAHSSSGERLAEIAAGVGTDPAYLARAFRRHMGCTMSEYRRRLWVCNATHLLTSTNKSLCDIAVSAGFADQSHLCRVFKAELGLTPLAYRHLAE